MNLKSETLSEPLSEPMSTHITKTMNQPAVTKSGTGTWGLGRRDSGTRGRGDVGTPGRGTRARAGDSRTWDVGTGRRDKQTSPDFLR